MAGSDEFKKELSNAARNKQIREEIGNDPERLAQRISGVDREKYDVSGFSDKEINMALQGGEFGDKDYARLTGQEFNADPKPEDGGDSGIGEDPKPVAPVQPPAVGEQDQWMDIPGAAPGADGGMSQNVQQDNDITTSITGDGNTVTNQQDNSVGQFLGGYMRKHNFFK